MQRRCFVGGALTTLGLATLPSTTAIAATTSSLPSPVAPPVADRLEIQFGPALVRPMFSRWKDLGTSNIPLFAGLADLRQQLGNEQILLPLVRLRDNQHLPPNAWQILVYGEIVDEGSITAKQKWNPLNHLPILARLATAVCERQEQLLES